MRRRVLTLVAMMFIIVLLVGCSSHREVIPVDVPIDEEHFGSICFWVELRDTDHDGILSIEENKQIDVLDMLETNGEVASIELKYFFFLERIQIYDLSDCEELDFTNQIYLKELTIEKSDVEKINLLNNEQLELLRINFAPNLTKLNLGSKPKLTKLDCSSCNLESIDVSKCEALESLWCDFNRLTKLDLSNNYNLKSVNCSDNLLVKLDVSDCENLEAVFCTDNELRKLDVSANLNLRLLMCSRNNLKTINISANTKLERFGCDDDCEVIGYYN